MDSDFACLLFAGAELRHQLASGAADTAMPNLHARIIELLLLRLPPVPEQREIADIVSTVDERVAAEESYARVLEGLFKTLLAELMTGRRRLHRAILPELAHLRQSKPKVREMPYVRSAVQES